MEFPSTAHTPRLPSLDTDSPDGGSLQSGDYRMALRDICFCEKPVEITIRICVRRVPRGKGISGAYEAKDYSRYLP